MIVKLFADDGTLLFAGACDDADPSQFVALDQTVGQPTRLRVNVTDLSALADRVGVPQPARPAQTFDTVECKWRDSPRQPRPKPGECDEFRPHPRHEFSYRGLVRECSGAGRTPESAENPS